jgi:putative MATE family efflux protein
MSVRFTMVSVLMALSMGGGAVVARYLGAKDQKGANLAALQGIILMLIASGGLGLVGLVFARPLMQLAGADAETLPLAVRYSRIIFGGLIAIEMVPAMGSMFVAAGAPRLMLNMTLCSGLTLLASDPLLVHWLGLEGAALAFVGGHVVGMLWGFRMLFTGRAPVRLDPRNLRLDLPMMGRILRVSLPAVVQRGAPNLAMSLLTRFVSWYGASALAAWVIVQRAFGFALIPGMGLANSTSAMVGQNLGAAQPERATRSVGLIARAAGLVNGGVIALLALLAPQVLTLFSQDAETVRVGVHVVQALSLGYLAFTLSAVFGAAQTGAGDTMPPMLINTAASWLVLIPLAYLLPRLTGLEADGIWLALTLSWSVQAALLNLRFRQGRWKLKQVL